MKSKTKTSVNHNTVQAMISVAGLGDATSIEELKDGEFNVAFKVKTGDNDYVIKIAPNADADVLTYEKDLMATELAVYDLIAKNTDVRIPKIFYESREINGSPWYVMEFLAAKPLFKMKLTNTQTNNIMFELGVSVAKINAVKNDAFGYIQNGLKTSWKEAYNSMVSAVLSDAKRLNLRVPKLKKILALIEKNANVLEEVATPRLIHFDLWKGNIFVNENMQLEGIIDTERAMWGDLYGEFINLDFLGDFKKNTAFIEGYNSAADEKIVFTGSTEKRMDLMRLYLSLIIFTEADSRLDKTNIAYWFKKVFSRLLMNKAIKGLNK